MVQYNYDTIEDMKLGLRYVVKKYNYCLLPMYYYSTEYKGKKYFAMQNGQTGKVSKIPKSPLKLLLLFGGCALLVALIFIIIQFI